MPSQRIVIVGAGLAGGTAALALKEKGFDGEIVLLGAEDLPPYERPPLSKALMQGDQEEPDWVLDDGGTDAWAQKGIELRLGSRVESLDAAPRVLTLAGGEQIGYDRLVLATGAEAFRPNIPGAQLSGVRTLRALDDARGLRDDARAAGRVAIIGGSWIGCEVAASLRQQDCDVLLVESKSGLLGGLRSEEVSRRISALHREHGVDLRLNADLKELGGDGRVEYVELAEGRSEASLVLLATGIAPALELAKQAGLQEAAGGIAVDATLRTSDPAIWAIGDIAAVDHPLYGTHVRVEHWDVAQQMGRHVAGSLTGDAQPYDKPPFFFSDQYDLGFEYRGWVDPDGPEPQVVIRGDDPAGEWFAFWLVDGRIRAVMNVNAYDDSEALWKLASGTTRVSPDRLRDPSIPLADLA